MDLEERFEVVKRGSEEIVTEEGLKDLLKKDEFRVYCGYEPSGKLHFGHALTVQKLIDLQEFGAEVVVLFADLHAFLNDKGELDEIRELARYNKECFIGFGLDPDQTEFVLGSDFQLDSDYSMNVLQLATQSTLNRARRSMDMIARHLDNPDVAQVIYPLMQAVDMDWLGVDMAVGGIDQRKVHMIAREKLPSIGSEKPVFVHTPLLHGLDGSEKMSSTKRNFIALDDSPEKIREKVNGAFCPEKEIKNNPIFEYVVQFIFPRIQKLSIERPEKYGGSIELNSLEELRKVYLSGELHPADLKKAVAEALIDMLEPVRNHLE
ncbi:MAG: tyrosine--tRNA ligase [Hadesarchaea archaeon]|nr:tyrosine--tRNA ligase [Hadesarchaea archaeon]